MRRVSTVKVEEEDGVVDCHVGYSEAGIVLLVDFDDGLCRRMRLRTDFGDVEVEWTEGQLRKKRVNALQYRIDSMTGAQLAATATAIRKGSGFTPMLCAI